MSEVSHKNRYVPYIKVFIECFVLFLIGVSPFIIFTKGVYISYGDYNVQNIPFWNHFYDMYHDGLPAWDWESDLGMGFLTGYTFYGLTSPYTLISLIFPKSALPYVMTFLNAFKFGVAGLSAYIYTKQYVKSDVSAQVCGILYAFSGAQLFDMVFHFSDIISLFPLLLFAFDKLVSEKKRGFFAVMLAITGFTNYYFLFGICVFLLIYFAVKVWCKEFVIDRRSFLGIAFEAVIGVAMAAIVLLPSFYALLQNKRASSSIFDINLLSYEESGTVWRIFYSMFFMPDLCNISGLFPNAQLNVASISLYIPLFSVAGVYSVIRREPKKWYSRLCSVCLIFALIPVLNSVFSALNSRYYARWFFMPLLIMIMMTGKFIDDFWETDIKKTLKLLVCVIVGFLLFGFNIIIKDPEYILVAFGVSLLSVLILYMIRYKKDSSFRKKLNRLVCVFSVIPFIFSSLYISGMYNWEFSDYYIDLLYNDFEPIELDDDTYFRTLTQDYTANVSLNYHYPAVNMFNSMVPETTCDFFDAVDIFRLQNLEYNDSNYAIYSFLSVKYELYHNMLLSGGIEVEPDDVPYVRPYFTQDKVCNRYIVYENQKYIPMGFTYDNYININGIIRSESAGFDEVDKMVPTEKYNKEESLRREKLLLKGIWLDNGQIEKYGDILTELPEELMEDTSDEAFEKDCEARIKGAAYEFTPDKTGFTSKIDLERDNLVFYSVPYDEGFTAYVDGNEVEIEKVFNGLTAVKVPKGDHTIRFEYTVRGLKAGTIVTVASLGIYIIYLIAAFVIGRKGAASDKQEQI